MYGGAGLNTLHVLIYRKKAGQVFFRYIPFKYITCSYLSHVFKPFSNSIYLFSPLNSSIFQNFTSRLFFLRETNFNSPIMHKYAVFPLYLMIPPGKIATLKSHLYFFPALLKSPNTDFDNNSAEHPSGKFGLLETTFLIVFILI